MKNFKIATVGLCFLTLTSTFVGCATKQGTGALAGAGGGAALGAIIGAIAGHGKGAAIGAAIGGAVGAVTDANGLKAVKVTFDSGILFATNKADLNQASKNSLAKFSTVLKNNSDCYVDIYGHTDSTGNDGINIPLSNNRAKSVYNYLTSCGVASNQIQKVEGKGSSQPVADNSTVDGRKQNRRVEVYLYASQALVDKANNGELQ